MTPAIVTRTREIKFPQNRIKMATYKGVSFQDRQKSMAEAKKALLEKFKARPAADDPVVIEREAQSRAIFVAREARAAERARQKAEQHAAMQAQLKADEEAREAASIAEAARLQLEAEAAIQAKDRLEIEKKAERDARYAARKGRKAEAKSEKRRYR
ncbi:DUF6481 family protein [Rhodoblastus acidophilus]